MKTLPGVLAELVSHGYGDRIVYDRKGRSFTLQLLLDAARAGKITPKSISKKKEFFGGFTDDGRVTIARQPRSGSFVILLEGEAPHGRDTVSLDFEGAGPAIGRRLRR